MRDIKVKSLDLKLKEGHAVCFDFDGVIHKYSKGWQDGNIYDEYNKNVLDLMLFLQKAGIPIFICSTREPMQIINWWNKQGFWCKATRVNDNETFWNELELIGVTNRKLPAQMYIDDRAYKYTGQTVKQFILDNSEKMEEQLMNKEEIEKGDKEHLIEVLTEYKNYIFEFDDDNIKVEYILDYIRELEFQNTALKAEHNHNITRIKELEQKETILDKVTDYIKTYIDDKQNEYEAISESYVCQTDEDEYLKEKKLAIIKGQKQVLKNVLNIIEGEK